MSSTSNESITSWYGLNFPTKRPLADLPRPINLRSAADVFLVGYASDHQHDVCKNLVLDCRDRGQNVGVGQFTDEEDMIILFHLSQVFVISKVKIGGIRSGEREQEEENCGIDGIIVIQPSMMSRTVDSCLAHIHIFITDSLLSRDHHVIDDLLSLAVTLTSQLDLGYTRCLATVAGALPALVAAYRRQGFLVVATIPEGVKLNGLGTSDDLIMAKSLGLPSRERRTRTEIEELCSRLASTTTCRNVIESVDRGQMLQVPFLPKPYVYQNGFKVLVRQMRASEAPQIYEIWMEAAEKGQGYGIDECPTLDIFKLMILSNHYCVVFEDLSTHDIVGLTLISDSWYTRNPDSRYGESSLFIAEKYRGRGLGSESTHIELTLMKQLGYAGSLNDTLLSNSQMFKTLKRSPVPPLCLGVIPDGTYTAGRGWDDQVLVLADFRSSSLVQNFVEVAENSLARNQPSMEKTLAKL